MDFGSSVSGGYGGDASDRLFSISLASAGPSTLPKEEKRVFAGRETNYIGDIEGSNHQNSFKKKFYNKPTWGPSDISGATPKPLTHSRNCPDNTLRIDDIDGTRRTIKDRMMRTNRHVDPLDPVYPLPSFTPAENYVPKFIKDSINVDDIEGAKPKVKREFQTRNTMDCSDIDGARPGLKSRNKLYSMQPRDLLDCQDICKRDHRFQDHTTRVTDPNNPTYYINGTLITDSEKSKPKKERKYIPNFTLETKDITKADQEKDIMWINNNFLRREIKNTNYIGDIEGSGPDSVKHAIRTTRNVNPLQPIYQSLDSNELLLPVIQPLIPAELVTVPTLPKIIQPNSITKNKMTQSREVKGNIISGENPETSFSPGYTSKIENPHTNKIQVASNSSNNNDSKSNIGSQDNLFYSNSFAPSDGTKPIWGHNLEQFGTYNGGAKLDSTLFTTVPTQTQSKPPISNTSKHSFNLPLDTSINNSNNSSSNNNSSRRNSSRGSNGNPFLSGRSKSAAAGSSVISPSPSSSRLEIERQNEIDAVRNLQF